MLVSGPASISRTMPCAAIASQLGLEFLGEAGAAGVADPDVRTWRVGGDRRRRRGARPPQPAQTAVGRVGTRSSFSTPPTLVKRPVR